MTKRKQEAPERLFIHVGSQVETKPCGCGGDVEYVRADLLQQPTSERESALREALEAIIIRCTDGARDYDWRPVIRGIAQRAIDQTSTGERCGECGHSKTAPNGFCVGRDATSGDGLCKCRCVFPTAEAPNCARAIELLRSLRDATDPAEVARQKESWAALEPDLHGVATTGADEGTERWTPADPPIRRIKVDAPTPVQPPAAPRDAAARKVACEIVHQHVPLTVQLPHGINGLESAIVDALVHFPPTEATQVAVEAKEEVND